MGRHSDEKGSWFPVWSKRWLKNKDFIKFGPEFELSFLRALCAANECRDDGRFIMHGLLVLVPEQICVTSRITEEQFKKLLKEEFIIKTGNVYSIKNWEKWEVGKRK